MNVFKLGVTFVKSLSALFVPGKCPKRIDNEKNVAGESLASNSTSSDIIGYLKAQQPHYDLSRFLDAQEFDYTQVLKELKEGRKQSHWIWYIFPQQKGLGHSYNSKYYGLDGEGEARAYIEHEILGERLRECCKALLLHKGKDIEYIMGSGVDVMKLNTSMNLFNRVSPNDVFEEVLDVFFKKTEPTLKNGACLKCLYFTKITDYDNY